MFSRIKVREDTLDWKDGIDDIDASMYMTLDESSIFKHVHVGRIEYNSILHKLEYEIHKQVETKYEIDTLDGVLDIFNAIVAFVMDNERRGATGFIGRVLESNPTCSDNDTETMSTSPSETDNMHSHFSYVCSSCVITDRFLVLAD